MARPGPINIWAVLPGRQAYKEAILGNINFYDD
jgi:hypothetical protein